MLNLYIFVYIHFDYLLLLLNDVRHLPQHALLVQPHYTGIEVRDMHIQILVRYHMRLTFVQSLNQLRIPLKIAHECG